MEVGFPANGRTINSGELIKIFFEFLPECVKGIIFLSVCRSEKKIEQTIFLAEDQQVIREEILKRNLSAFVANGSILPESGISSRPMKNGVPFRSPKEMEVEMGCRTEERLTVWGFHVELL